MADRKGAEGSRHQAHRAGLAVAEATAWPFADVRAFRGGGTQTDTSILEPGLARRLTQLGASERADTLAAHVWVPNEQLDKFLVRSARRLLESHGEVAYLVPDHDNPGEEILRWRWMSLVLPPDLLVAAADLSGSSSRVQLLDPTLHILQRTAHLHMHATAVVPFTTIWTGIGETMDLSKVRSCPEGFFGRREWQAWLRRAFVARHVLSWWMRYGLEHIKEVVRHHPHVKHAVGDLKVGRLRDRSVLLEADLDGFVRWVEYRRRRHVRSARDRASEHQGLAFNRRCLAYLNLDRGTHHERFRTLWVQMTRVRVLLYRHLVHDPAHCGLDSFATRFDRLHEYLTDRIEDDVTRIVGQEPGLRVDSIELRKAPGGVSKLKSLHDKSRESLQKRFPRRQRRPRITWILHFIRDQGASQGLRGQVARHYQTAWSLAAAIRQRPEFLRSIRGLDVASRELRGPLWAVAAPLHYVREESRRVAARHGGKIRPLRLTVHAGEDFRHLLTGLRAVHEPFWWEIMQRGDRLGHALALGWDPYLWCSKHPEVLQPRSERMLDLAWLLDFVARRRLESVSAGMLEAARQELQRHVRKWDRDAHISDFLALARSLGRPRLWAAIDAPYWDPSRFKHGPWHLCGRLLELQGRETGMVTVRTEGEAGILLVLRDELARLFARWRVPIEINPSSNLLIGDFAHPVSQPLFHLDPFDRKEDRGLVLTLSADDPVSFATTLADEFAYAWAGLVVGGGEAPAYAQEWLERAARAARRAVF